MLANFMGGSVGPIITDFLSRKYMYIYPSESSSDESRKSENTFGSDKGYTLAIVFIAVVSIVSFILTLLLKDMLSVCKKGKKTINDGENKGNNENIIEVDETTGLLINE